MSWNYGAFKPVTESDVLNMTAAELLEAYESLAEGAPLDCCTVRLATGTHAGTAALSCHEPPAAVLVDHDATIGSVARQHCAGDRLVILFDCFATRESAAQP